MLLDQIIDSKKQAVEKLQSGQMLLFEEEEVLREQAGLPTNKRNKKKTSMPTVKTYESETTSALQSLLDSFDVANCTKKDIKDLRKMLTTLKNEKFPRKSK